MVHVLLTLLASSSQEAFPEKVPPLEPVRTTVSQPASEQLQAAANRIVVDLKKQRLIAYEGGKAVYSFHCSTGRHNATPVGDFSVRQKARHNRALPKYGSVPIPYSLRLDIVRNGRRVLISIHAFKSVPSYPASHGCIRLRYPDAKKLFAWAEVGDRVEIVRFEPKQTDAPPAIP